VAVVRIALVVDGEPGEDPIPCGVGVPVRQDPWEHRAEDLVLPERGDVADREAAGRDQLGDPSQVGVDPVRVEVLVDVEAADDVVLIGERDIQQVPDVDARADAGVGSPGSSRADLHSLAVDSQVRQGKEDGTAGTAEVEDASRAQGGHQLGHRPLVEVDLRPPDPRLVVVAVLDDLALHPVELRRGAGGEDGDGRAASIGSVLVGLRTQGAQVRQAIGGPRDPIHVLVGCNQLTDDVLP